MNYYTKQDTEQFSFIKMPRFLFHNPKYIILSAMAKLMYGLILDRISISRKNNWIDQQGYVYIIYTVEETAKVLNCSEDTATKVLRELSDEGVGLITRKRRGQGKPSVIYVYNIPDNKIEDTTFTSVQQNFENDVETRGKFFVPISETDNAEVKNPTNPDSRIQENRIQEVEKNGCNQNNSNQTEYNQTDMNHLSSEIASTSSEYSSVESLTDKMEDISHMINYDMLCSEYGEPKANKIRSLIYDVLIGKRVVKVNGEIISQDKAVSTFNKLDHKTVVSVLESMSRTTVYSPMAWIPTALYNAVTQQRHSNNSHRTFQSCCSHSTKKSDFMSEPSFDLDLIMEYALKVPPRVRPRTT